MSYDLALGADGDLPISPRHITGVEMTMQRVKIRLRTFLGEWILDGSQGVDWIGWMQDKPPNLQKIAGFIRAELEGAPGVTRVDGLRVAFDASTAKVSISGDIVIGADTVRLDATTSSGAGANNAPWALIFSSGPIATAGHR